MDDSNTLENRQGLLEHSHSYTVCLPLFSSGVAIFYLSVYLLRYYCWRIKQRRRKVRLLEYEKLRCLWHRKQSQLCRQTKEEKIKVDPANEQSCADIEKYPYSRSPSSLSVTTVKDNKNGYESKVKAKQNQHQQQQQQKKCDYGDDSSHCRESNLELTIPSPAYQPSHNRHGHSTPKPRLSNHKTTTTQLHHHHHHHHYHEHQEENSSSSTSSSSSSTRKSSSQSHHHHHGSYYSSSSSTTTLTCSCSQQHRCKKEHNNSGTSPCLTSSPTTLSFSSPTSPSSSLKEKTANFFYSSPEEDEGENEKVVTHKNNRPHPPSFNPPYDTSCISQTNPTVAPYTTSKPRKPQCAPRQTYWSYYDSKAKRTRMMWKWSVAMGYCHYDHAKMITSIIDQWEPPPSHGIC